MPDLSNIRDYLGWIIGRRVVDVTAGDPPGLPDHVDDAHFVVLHFDNGGTLDVPIGDEGFSYNNPAAAAADRGELCEDCQGGLHAYRSSTEEARLKETARAFLQRQDEVSAILRAKGYPIAGHEIGEDSTSWTSRRERGAERLTQVDPRDAPDGPGFFGTAVQVRLVPFKISGADDAMHVIEDYPHWWAPKNPSYVKSHVNAPGTVRAWFRQMRAADFERDLLVNIAQDGVAGIDVLAGHSPRIWTLFDTQQVVDRETAAHYAPPIVPPFTLFGFPVVFAMPSEGGGFLPTVGQAEAAINRGWRKDIDRSPYPQFSSKVQPSTGALTLEMIRQSIAPQGPPPCPKCGRARRWTPAPASLYLYGPGSGPLLYHYAKLAESDRCYGDPSHRVAMCDSCQHGEIRP